MILDSYLNKSGLVKLITQRFFTMKHIWSIVLSLVALGLSSNIVVGQVLPEELARLAISNNKSLQEMMVMVDIAREKSTQASSLSDPQLSFGYFLSPVETRNGPQRFSLAVSQSMPWFGVRSLRASVAETEVDIRLSNYTMERNKLLFQLESLWIERAYLIENATLLDELAKETSLALVVLKSQSETGNRSLVDVLNREVALEKIAIDSRSNTQKIRSIEANLRGLIQSEVDFPNDGFPSVNDLPLAPEPDEVSLLLATNEELVKAQKDIQKALSSIDLVSASQRPSFMIGASYINIGEATGMAGSDNGKDAFILPQVGLSLPIWGGKNRSQRREAELASHASQLRLEGLSERFRGQLLGAIYSFTEAKNRLADIQNLLHSSQEVWNQSLVQLELGNRSYSDVLPVIERHLTLRRSLLESHKSALSAFAQITFLTSSYL